MPDSLDGLWFHAEFMGHVSLYGKLFEVVHFGQTLVRVDIPTGDEDEDWNWRSEYFGPSGIYRLTPITEEDGRRYAGYRRRLALTPGVAGTPVDVSPYYPPEEDEDEYTGPERPDDDEDDEDDESPGDAVGHAARDPFAPEDIPFG